MYCPNCGTANEGAVRFCANCGTPLDATAAGSAVPPVVPQPPVVPTYAPPPAPQTRDGFLKFLGMGCLVILAIFVLFGVGCARACLFRRRLFRYR